jgi:prepilin-type N-terminal cleavage/methylation domain-containing protein
VKTNLSRTPSHAGFSLIELLVVIAVIGIIAAIAIPNIGNINSSAQTVTNQRNAQSIVSLYEAGSAAGVAWTGGNRNQKVAAVVAGDTPQNGIFAGKSFRVPNLSPQDQAGAYRYIGYDSNGDLFYDKAGGQPAN